MLDYRKFVFTATQELTNIAEFGLLDLADNLAPEFARLEAVMELLEGADPEKFEPRVLVGVALILREVHARMRAQIDLALSRSQRGHPLRPRRSTARPSPRRSKSRRGGARPG